VAHEVNWPLPQPRKFTVRDAIADLPEIAAGHIAEEAEWNRPKIVNAYLAEMRKGLTRDSKTKVRDHVTRAHREEDIRSFSFMGEGDKYSAVPVELRRYRDDIFTDKYHRMKWSHPAWTVTAHLSKDGYKYIHPQQNRTLSVREAARLQSFPDRFRLAGSRTSRWAQIGNAVPPKLAAALGATIRDLFA
jgi:DNA (cytosine-5)-methyltransferase 1